MQATHSLLCPAPNGGMRRATIIAIGEEVGNHSIVGVAEYIANLASINIWPQYDEFADWTDAMAESLMMVGRCDIWGNERP